MSSSSEIRSSAGPAAPGLGSRQAIRAMCSMSSARSALPVIAAPKTIRQVVWTRVRRCVDHQVLGCAGRGRPQQLLAGDQLSAAPPTTSRWTADSTPRQARVRRIMKRPPVVRPYGGSEPNTTRSTGTRASSESRS